MKPGWIALTLLAGLWPALAQQYTIQTIAGGAPPSTPANALATSIGQPRRLALDKAGNLYFSASNSVFKMDPTGVLTLIAGNSRPGFAGDGGQAVAATLNNPQGIAIDAAGNIYIADTGNSRVRVVAPGGIISTFAGNGAAGYSGNYGLAINAQLAQPAGLAFDGNGNLFIADAGNNVIREVTTDGLINTVVGDGYQGYVGDTGIAVSAALNNPTDVFIDPKGNIFIADTGNNVVREVTVSDGNIYTFAGSIPPASGSRVPGIGDGSISNTAVLNAPRGVLVDAQGNVYIADYGNYRIRKATPNTDTNTVTQNPNGTTTIGYYSNSIINTVAGSGTPGFGDASTGISGMLASPMGMALDSSGNLYIADVFNLRVRKLASGGGLGTVAGNGLLSFSGDGSAATKAQLFAPRGVASDGQGNLYIADTANNRIRKIAAGGVISTIAGTGAAGFGGDGGPAAAAQLNQPTDVKVDVSGNLWIADYGNNRVRVITPSGISTAAGNGTAGFSGDGAAATSASMNGPIALALDGSNLYVSDTNNNRVRKFTPGQSITTVAGNGLNGFGGDGNQATSALLNGPTGLAVDAAHNLYIADTDNSRIRMVTPSGTITTFAGNGADAVAGDGGPVSQATLAAPESLAFDRSGNLFVGDSVGRVRIISAAGTISTIAGRGTAGYSGDGSDASLAQINGPFGLAVDLAANVYIADTFNNAIRELQPILALPNIKVITNGASNQSGSIAPGEVVTIYGTGLGPTTLTAATLINGRFPTTLAGTQVLINGTPAPILYTWTNQVGVVVPFALSGNAQVMVVNNNLQSPTQSLSFGSASPALFTADYSGKGQAAAINVNGSLNSTSTPAAAGSVITLIGTGGGAINPAQPDGSYSLTQSTLVAPLTVTIGGVSATVSFAGQAPGLVAGVMQVNATIPSTVTPGNVPVVVTVGGVSSPSGVTIAVK